MCGDNCNYIRLQLVSSGSPPRVWGQHPLYLARTRCRRFTPTCVGTTTVWLKITAGTSVHPHVCGDNLLSAVHVALSPGSPPRVWGQPISKSSVVDPTRFTPTCVGTTSALIPYTQGSTVHPHVCGDNSIIPLSIIAPPGSPPRVWGQRQIPAALLAPSRFTPTCVGTTPRPQCSAAAFSVHPHVCGDNAFKHAKTRPANGSPPRVWGQRESP